MSTAGLNASPVTAVQRRQLSHTAAFSRLATVQQVADFLCARLALRTEDARLWHLRDHASLLDDDNATLQDLGFRDSDQILIEVRNKDLTWPEEMGQLVASGGHELSVERRPTICLPPGATGLHNLGNTCFMNAALQAVSNTRPLTQYFQRDRQLSELNTSNPLGTKGVVARKYAELCNELWAGSTRSVAPLKLRVCVSKHAPHLGGGGQHDSQELLAWLLDALHEDLNRVTKKQYTELKDSGGRPDEIVAEEAWQQHLARDHSIITDLFYGQLKSKVSGLDKRVEFKDIKRHFDCRSHARRVATNLFVSTPSTCSVCLCRWRVTLSAKFWVSLFICLSLSDLCRTHSELICSCSIERRMSHQIRLETKLGSPLRRAEGAAASSERNRRTQVVAGRSGVLPDQIRAVGRGEDQSQHRDRIVRLRTAEEHFDGRDRRWGGGDGRTRNRCALTAISARSNKM